MVQVKSTINGKEDNIVVTYVSITCQALERSVEIISTFPVQGKIKLKN